MASIRAGAAPVKVSVTIDAQGIHVEPKIADIPFDNPDVEIVWKIKTRGWRFTEQGIEIDQDDSLVKLLRHRDEQVIGMLKSNTPASAKQFRKEMERAYAEFIVNGPRGGVFHDPQVLDGGKRYRWISKNQYPQIYKYTIHVTNGSTTMSHDPAIQNQGC